MAKLHLKAIALVQQPPISSERHRARLFLNHWPAFGGQLRRVGHPHTLTSSAAADFARLDVGNFGGLLLPVHIQLLPPGQQYDPRQPLMQD